MTRRKLAGINQASVFEYAIDRAAFSSRLELASALSCSSPVVRGPPVMSNVAAHPRLHRFQAAVGCSRVFGGLSTRVHKSRSTMTTSTHRPCNFACRSALPTIRKPCFWYVERATALSARIYVKIFS